VQINLHNDRHAVFIDGSNSITLRTDLVRMVQIDVCCLWYVMESEETKREEEW